MKPRVLLVGIDGATFDVILPLAREGRLPYLRRLIEEGAYGNLYSPLSFTPPAWSSIYTGKEPGKHGVFHFVRRRPDSYAFTPVSSLSRDSKDIWEILSEKGLKVGILNAPVTYPPRKVNGFMITGFMTPGEKSEYTYPSGLKKEIHQKVRGYYNRSPYVLRIGLTNRFYVRLFLNYLHRNIESVGTLARTLMREKEWSFFMVAFSETDIVHHGFWGAMDTSHRIVTSRYKKKYCDVIPQIYMRIDQEIGRILREVDADTHVMVISDHGGAPLDTFFHINHFLHSIGQLYFKRDSKAKAKRYLRALFGNFLLKAQRVSGLLTIIGLLKLKLSNSLADIDWSITKAYSPGAGQIYINLRGREPLGTVSPGQEYQELRRYISDKLHDVRDPRNGKLIVKDVLLREDIFSGPYADTAPDLQFSVAQGYAPFPGGSINGKIFTDSIEWSGGHSPMGIFMMKGPGVEKVQLKDLELTQVAPTILYLLNCKVPADMDGGVITEAFDKNRLLESPVQKEFAAYQSKREEVLLSRDEEKKVEERLRALGYM